MREYNKQRGQKDNERTEELKKAEAGHGTVKEYILSADELADIHAKYGPPGTMVENKFFVYNGNQRGKR